MPTQKINYPQWIIIHHSGGTDSDPLADTSHHGVKEIDDWHRQKRFPKSELGYYVGYHYVINKDGNVAQTRGDKEVGAHCKGMNFSSIGIVLSGNFDRLPHSENSYPTKEQIASLRTLLDELTDRHLIVGSRIVPHRAFSSKSCYGKNLGDAWGKNLFGDVIREKMLMIETIIMLLIKIKNFLPKGRLNKNETLT